MKQPVHHVNHVACDKSSLSQTDILSGDIGMLAQRRHEIVSWLMTHGSYIGISVRNYGHHGELQMTGFTQGYIEILYLLRS